MDRRLFLKAAGTAAAAGSLLHEVGAERANIRQASPAKPVETQCPASADESYSHIGLAGTWAFKLDPSGKGIEEHWFERDLSDEQIFLPGSTDQAGYGEKITAPAVGRLSRPYRYAGPAWYRKEFTIPEAWRGCRVMLFLERCHWQTRVWVDGVSYGSQDSLCVPHEYDFGTGLASGRHTLTLCVDNTIRIDLGESAHAISENTQTNWNGVIGKIELRSTPALWIDRVRVFTDARSRTAKLEVRLGNALSGAAAGELEAKLPESGVSARVPVPSFTGRVAIAVTLPLAATLRDWDDLDPNLHVIELRAKTVAGERIFEHGIRVPFGIREIAARDRQFVLNGRPIFLRGTVENAVFPLTAYPPVEAEEWRRIFCIMRDYGMNHLRFHSWCPPEAAFAAADEVGVLLHVELPVFAHHIDKIPGLKEFMRQEGRRIIDTYGNHPSFVLLAMGNELTGDFPFLDELVAELKKADDRRLYTYSTNNGRQAPGPTSDYWVTEETAQGRLRIDKTRFGKQPGGTDYDFAKAVAAFDLPVVAHELGQWTVYPSYDEIGKYTGVLKPRNLEVFREQLAARGMADQAEAFQAASGHFAAAVYKEDIESALRTPKLGGFQLLELTDYPGQKEAPVGLLNCFWDSKGVLSPEAFRRFCGDTVPLCRFEKFVWITRETFRATAHVAHYGKWPLAGAPVFWTVSDESGRVVKSGKLRPCAAMPGEVALLGEIAFSLDFVLQAARLTLTLRVGSPETVNSWNLWVYPAALPPQDTGNVLVTSVFDRAAERLQAGGTVLFCAPPQSPSGRLLKLRFLPVFWSFAMFPKQPGVLGVLCDPRHPALAAFPTGMHSDWQWWEVTESTNAFILDDAPAGLRPLIQVIDDFHRNRKLGLVFEARVGKGRLLATSLPLAGDLDTRPVQRQLRYSLLKYAAGGEFKPEVEIDMDAARSLLSASE